MSNRLPFTSLIFILLIALSSILPAYELKPIDSVQLYPSPETSVKMRFTSIGTVDEDFIAYDLLNYGGEKVDSGKLLRNEHGQWELQFKRSAGFYEFALPNGQRIGVLCADAAKKPYDDFFAHEALFGGESPDYIRDYIAILRKFGLMNVREYCGWENIEGASSPDYSRDCALWNTISGGGLHPMIMFDRLPAIANVDGKSNLPRYMHQLGDAVDRLLDNCSNVDYIQVFNEFVNRPGDASVPATVLFGNRIKQKHSKTILIGQGMCAAQQAPNALASFVKNGYHELVDALCIQTYAAPEAIEGNVRDYRNALEGDARQGMAIWCTESGKPWYRGGVSSTLQGKVEHEKRRADLQDDITSAKWIAMKAVEFKACGAKRYFPFTQKPHVENANNFGMIDFLHTPMRSQAAYLVLPTMIGEMEYIGDLSFPRDANITISRVFAGKGRTVAVLYRGNDDTTAVSLKGLPVLAIYAIDGANIPVSSSYEAKMTGGMLYVELDGGKLKERLVTDTVAMRLFRMGNDYVYQPRKVFPAAFLYDYSPERDGACDMAGYNTLPRQIDVVLLNFTSQPLTVNPRLILPEGAGIIKGSHEEFTIPENGEVVTSWLVDWTDCNDSNPVFTLQDSNGNAPPLSLRFFNPEKCDSKTFDFMNVERWERNCNGDMSIQYDPPEDALRIHVDFLGRTDRWVFPRFVLKEGDSLDDVVALEFKIKAIQSPREKRYAHSIVFIGDRRFGYDPPTEEWETRRVQLKDAIPENVKSIKIGMGAYSPEIVFWLKDIRLLKTSR